MSLEIERKFLLASDAWRNGASSGRRLKQGYLAKSITGATVRLRITGDEAFLTIKSPSDGMTRSEFEYNIPLADAEDMFEKLCSGCAVEKIRYLVPAGDDLRWEIDEYLGENAGLFTAEIELPSPDTKFDCPAWLGKEITDDYRYANSALSEKPFSTWREKNA